MPAAARLADLHVCPLVTPGDPPTAHDGGPRVGPGVATVLIGGLPAAVLGDSALCTDAAPDTIVQGSASVLIGQRPAARVGDATAHGGRIATGCPTVLIGG